MKKSKATSCSIPRRTRWPTVFAIVGCAAAVFCVGAGFEGWFGPQGSDGKASAAVSTLTLDKIPFNGARAYEDLKRLCAIGPRPSGSKGMEAQQKLLAEHFQKLGAQVEFQKFRIRHPKDGTIVPMANLIVRWWPDRKNRILLCAHYDTLPFPRMDPEDPAGVFVGANDNAGGAAVLMELGRDMAKLKCRYGVDFVFLDGEEYIFSDRDPMFIGSEFFAREYAKLQAEKNPSYSYRWGVLLDMIGDADLYIPIERNGYSWRDTRPLISEIWDVAAHLGVREFASEKKYDMDDDHILLHNIGRIPCVDLIDFDYPPWHTREDTPDKCSPLSLAKVGWVLREWLAATK